MIQISIYIGKMAALLDVTNVSKEHVVRKRRSDGTIKAYTYASRLRKTLQLTFHSEAEKIEFEEKMHKVSTLVSSNLCTKSSNTDVLNTLLDSYMRADSNQEEVTGIENNIPEQNCSCNGPNTNIFNDETMFVCESQKLRELIVRVQDHCKTCKHNLIIKDEQRHGHVTTLLFRCCVGHLVLFESSRKEGTQYSANMRFVLGFACSGMLDVQFTKFCKFSRIGCLTDHEKGKLMQTFHPVVQSLKEECIQEAVEEETSMATEQGEGGISIMTDARHSCRKNSYHTDHLALGQLSHKIVDVQHITKDDDTCSQRHEALGFDRMYQSFDGAGIKVQDHSHDRNATINNKIKTSRPETNNSNDRWHATKGITAAIRKIGTGAKKRQGIEWHPQLADKGSLIKTHFYWAMDNCNNSHEKLKENLESCITHFQNKHEYCHPDSRCRQPPYVPSFIVIKDPIAVKLLKNFVQSHVVYKQAKDYVFARDTGYIESANNSALIYLDKRIHYGNITYETRQNLWVLDWNEHVNRPYTSRYKKQRVDNERQNFGQKTYTKKTYNFVDQLWDKWLNAI